MSGLLPVYRYFDAQQTGIGYCQQPPQPVSQRLGSAGAKRAAQLLMLSAKALLALIACMGLWLPQPLRADGGRQYVTVTAHYETPDVALFDATGESVRLRELLAQPRPVILQFIFTSCSTICPLLSATFSQAQSALEDMQLDYQMISISIDPEYDSAERLTAYGKRFHAGPNWTLLSGRKNDVHRVLEAFGALYQGDNKMYHRPLFYLRAAPHAAWLRIEGFVSAAELAEQLRTLPCPDHISLR
jgi:cytochrome oxidase Cu insertion factor (SCO1/SenC/PrrC family)